MISFYIFWHDHWLSDHFRPNFQIHFRRSMLSCWVGKKKKSVFYYFSFLSFSCFTHSSENIFLHPTRTTRRLEFHIFLLWSRIEKEKIKEGYFGKWRKECWGKKKRDIQKLKHKKASDEDHSWKLNLTLCLRNSGLAKSIQKICFNKNIYESVIKKDWKKESVSLK